MFRSGWIKSSSVWRRPGLEEAVEGACAIRDAFLSSIPGRNTAQYQLIVAIQPGLLFELMEVSSDQRSSPRDHLSWWLGGTGSCPSLGLNRLTLGPNRTTILLLLFGLVLLVRHPLHPSSSQSLQEEQSSCSSQLVELMMSSRVDLVSELPRDLPPGTLLSHGSFLINLEGELLAGSVH